MQGLEVVKKNVGKSENICIYNEGFSIEFSFYIRNVNINTEWCTFVCTIRTHTFVQHNKTCILKQKQFFINGTIKSYTPYASKSVPFIDSSLSLSLGSKASAGLSFVYL